MEQAAAAAVVTVEVAAQEQVAATIKVDVNAPSAADPSAGAAITVRIDGDADAGSSVEVEVEVEAGTTRLHSLYARFKASTFKFDFGDDANLATLAAIPLVQAHMRSKSTFTEHELFSIIFRFNRPNPSAHDEEQSVIARRFADAELLEIATGLVLRAVLRTRYRDARVMMAHVCGGAHNAPDLGFFLAHDQVFIVLPRQHAVHNTISIDIDVRTRQGGRDGDGDGGKLSLHISSEDVSVDADISGNHDSDGDDDGEDGEGDGVNPWVLLRVNVKHVITDKASVVAALRAILSEARDQRLTLLVLRQRFERDCGVPFGCAGCGSLTSFLKKQRSIFHVTEARKKKNLKSTVTLVSSASQHHLRHHHQPQPQPPRNRSRTPGQAPIERGPEAGRGSRGRGRDRGRGQGQEQGTAPSHGQKTTRPAGRGGLG
jgi:hypothetical protein